MIKCKKGRIKEGWRLKMRVSLISIISHYLPFQKTPPGHTHTHSYSHINTDGILQVSLILDGQLHIKPDGLLSKFKGGAGDI